MISRTVSATAILACTFALGLPLAGCGGVDQQGSATTGKLDDDLASRNHPATDAPTGAAGATPDATPGGEESSAVSVQVVDLDGYQEVLAKHKGRVVLVDFWATWCPPCMERFPETVQWARQFAPQGLVVISCSLDSPDAQDRVLTFLEKREANFDNLLYEHGASSRTMDELNIRGGIPFYKLYDRDGQLKFEFNTDPSGMEAIEELSQMEMRLRQLLVPPTESGDSPNSP